MPVQTKSPPSQKSLGFDTDALMHHRATGDWRTIPGWSLGRSPAVA